MTARTGALRRKGWAVGRAESRFSYAALSPIILYMIVFVLLPVILSFIYSLRNTKTGEFVGFGNYIEFLLEDPRGVTSLKNTFLYALIRIPPTVILGFFIANGLNRITKGRSILIFGYFAPFVTNMVAFSAVFMYLLNSRGLFNMILNAIGLPAQGFLFSLTEALPSIALMDAWKHLGFDVVIFLAALQGIPSTIYEAAIIDGASRWQVLRLIKIPLLQQTFLYLFVVLAIWTLQVFEPIYVMTQGGPLNSTRSVMFTAYQAGFVNIKFGYASAISYILFVIIFAVTIIQLRIGRSRWSY